MAGGGVVGSPSPESRGVVSLRGGVSSLASSGPFTSKPETHIPEEHKSHATTPSHCKHRGPGRLEASPEAPSLSVLICLPGALLPLASVQGCVLSPSLSAWSLSLVLPTGASGEPFWGVVRPYPCGAVRCHLGTLLVSGPEVKGSGSVYQVTKITFSIASSLLHGRPGLCE